MQSIHDQGPPLPCPAPFNMAAHVMRHADAQPGKCALSVIGRNGTQDWTYGQVQAAIRGTATGLLEAGIEPAQIVLMRLGNDVAFPIAYLGAIAAGIVPVPTSTQLTERETEAMIDELSPAAVLRDPDVACAAHPRQITLDALQEMRALPPAGYALGDPDRLAYAVYTSGTSGRPRAVAHAHRAIWARQMMVDGWYGLRAEDRLCHAGAFNWTYTLGTGLMDPWTIGGTALIPEPGTDLTTLPELLARHRATIFAAAPGVYRKMLQGRDRLDLPDLRHGLSAGEKLARPLHDRWMQATGRDLFEAYGMSECSTFISGCPDHPARADALGRPQPGRRVAILGPDGPVPRGTEGTIAVHRDDPGLMLGYLNAPDEAAARMQGDWFLTGDQGVMAADGQISYLGRDDDMMNAGGFRVSPLEVEAVLARHPGIVQVGVAEVAIREDASIIAAFYTGPEPLDEGDLRAYVQDNLARYKQPRAFIHLPELPTGGNGKLLRRALPAYFKAPSA
ncbi:Acyl-CoA synthetase (AMP-forming)/AMP-acid ligase II [Cribrihabitans marinus]|uniref:Acyl-CoA synthetase (AMP-forming)/AMP-acid ligase II n=1 Tax=Cribrihabitans marinus TaxID=1227549 RepID=A0A1H6W515_9RHOB|nr:class I adenylate-forming enzyme family protein [Cribrihabitans marinus]GGH25218.1 long-chain-fatty-acid--CoA ligase [Cribrihabitans marinus]SEJ07612.1 Acyl-CoA synthetase (AMP-forming)/AMP-acid ligase II [Cribrihabitans marinus]